ncbi:unnamed protein product [Paramecium sonneborni]|uniref:Uncharacterized protein n=1 Tax=Paramecium sonneborni TaxID=65129 RepID=A0A8S1QLH9_9CILI|nr:unnamed protein product [Paramecium sonneborni]
MAIVAQMIQQLFEFQGGFSKTIKQLQEQAKNYNNCYRESYQEIMNHYQQQKGKEIKSDLINNLQELSQNPQESTQISLNKHFDKLSKQYEIFNENILEYYFQKLEFDKFYQDSQLEKMVEKQNRRYFHFNIQEINPLNFDLINQITFQQQQLIQKQNNQFYQNEQFNNYISQTTYLVQQLIQIRERKEKEIKDKIEENNKLQEEIRRQQEELQKKMIGDTNNVNQENENNNYDIDNLSETEELTQSCQECGQQIKFNHFLTTCLHYYHEECIIQKIKANCNQTNIFCSCNSLINSRMIKDALKHQQQSQNSFTYENFLQNQVQQLIRQCKKDFTKCQCGFLYISDIQEEINNCINCQ